MKVATGKTEVVIDEVKYSFEVVRSLDGYLPGYQVWLPNSARNGNLLRFLKKIDLPQYMKHGYVLRYVCQTKDHFSAHLFQAQENWRADQVPVEKKAMREELTQELAHLPFNREEVGKFLDVVFSYLERKAESAEGLFDMDKSENEQVRAVALPWLKG